MMLCSGAVGLRGGQFFSGIRVDAHTAVWLAYRNSLMIFRRRLQVVHGAHARQRWQE